MNKFSVLIPFRNEKEEVGRTVKSVRETAGNKVDIIVVNDSSYDGYDYEKDLAPYNVEYHITKERLGSSAGKELCVQLCKTPYFLILDAHCRLHTPNWLELAEELMGRPESKKTIYCCTCWYFHNEYDQQSPDHMRAYGGYFDYNIKSILSCGWNLNNFSKEFKDEPFDVPCLLGANYICSKEWWNYIKGYQGLKLYGREEPFISIKSRMAGGNVQCYPKIVTGHKSRPGNKQPYDCYCYEIAHNEMVIAYICLPHLFDKLMAAWKSLYSFDSSIYNMALQLLNEHKEELDVLREYFAKIKVHEHAKLDKFNAAFQKRIGFSYKRQRETIENTYTKYCSDIKHKFSMG